MSSLLELLKQKKQDLAAGNRKKTVKPTDGTTRWRILPSWRGKDQPFWHDFGQHYVKDSAGKLLAIYACTEKTYGRPCQVCDAVREGTKAASDDHTMKLMKEAGASGRVLVNALHLDGPTPTEVQILELAPTAFGSIVNIASEWEEAGESIFDEARGKDILITRTGSGLLTKYSAQVAAKASVLPAGVMSKLNNLDEYVNQESSEQQLRALNSVRSVAGLLSAPSGGGGSTAREFAGLPVSASMGAATIDEDPYAVAAPPPRRAAPADITDVPDLPAAAVAVKPRPVVAKPTPVAAVPDDGTGDDELDALLADLG